MEIVFALVMIAFAFVCCMGADAYAYSKRLRRDNPEE